MEKKNGKIFKWIIGAVIAALAVYSAVTFLPKANVSNWDIISFNTQANDNLNDSKYTIYEDDTELCSFKEADDSWFYNVDSKYIWTDGERVYGVSEESLEEKLKEREEDLNLSILFEPNHIKTISEGIIKNMTEEYYSQVSYNMTPFYWRMIDVNGLYAFGGTDIVTEDAIENAFCMEQNPLTYMGLDLNCSNIELEKIVGFRNIPANRNDYNILVQVSSDVKTVKKPEEFKDVEWIAEEGHINRVTYILEVAEHSNGLFYNYVQSIVAVECEKIK